MAKFWEELKRRKVVRVAITYAVVSWLLIQVADIVLDNIAAPTWVFQTILLLLVIGFPVAIIIAWAFHAKLSRDKFLMKLYPRKIGFQHS